MFFSQKKEDEQKAIGWSAKRELAKINYHIHTSAISRNLIPPVVLQAIFLSPTFLIFFI